MKRLAKTLLILGITGLSLNSFSQEGKLDYGTGKDSSTCVENLSVYSFRYRNESATQEFTPETYKAWRTAFFTCPQGSKNMYVPHGVNMYRPLVEKATDEATKAKYIDTIMMIYDRRIEYFGEKTKYDGLKGADLFILNSSKYNEAYTLCKESVDARGMKADIKPIIILMQTSVLKYQDGSLPKTDALATYQKIMEIVDAKSDYKKMKPTLEQLFLQLEPTCEDLIALFQPQFDANPEDIETLKKITSYLSQNCNESELYLNAAVNLDKLEPSSLSKRNIAEMYFGKKDYKTAIEYYKQSIDLETDDNQKAESYYRMANLAINSPSESVSYLNKALAIDPNMGKAYLLKAKQYVAGSDACAKDAEYPIVETWKALWVAEDLCIKAKSVDPSIAAKANADISKYKGNFPGVETLFGYNIKVGDAQTISCWFNASTVAKSN